MANILRNVDKIITSAPASKEVDLNNIQASSGGATVINLSVTGYPPNWVFGLQSPTINVTATSVLSGVSISKLEYQIDSEGWNNISNTSGTGSFNFTINTLVTMSQDPNHSKQISVFVKATDALGNSTTKEQVILIKHEAVNTPIISNINNGDTVSTSGTIAINPVTMASGNTANHAETEYQVALDPSFSNIAWYKNTTNASELRQVQMALTAKGTNHFVRVRVREALYGWSAWSTTVNFTSSSYATLSGAPTRTYMDSNGDSWAQYEFNGTQNITVTTAGEFEYIIIGAGGGGGGTIAGGGGAGGYRSSIQGEMSGGGLNAEAPAQFPVAGTYTVKIGAGGLGGTGYTTPSNGMGTTGGDSYIQGNGINIISKGGGGGAGHGAGESLGQSGGSGGGRISTPANSGTAGQGFAGGTSGVEPQGGGGGAGAVGQNGVSNKGGNGGQGVVSYTTGTAIWRAGGGGAGIRSGSGSVGSGGQGGGGGGGTAQGAQSGSANTGGGGGGAGFSAYTSNRIGGTGGSGFVLIRVKV